MQNLKDFHNDIPLGEILDKYPLRIQKGRRNDDLTRAKVATLKLAEGDVKAAVRTLCSEDVIAPSDSKTLEELRIRHPAPPKDVRQVDYLKRTDVEPLFISYEQVREAIRSFPASSSGGYDGLSPRHLRDCLAGDNSGELLQSLALFVEEIVNGRLPSFALKYFNGASLTAFQKKSGGLRPIACGLSIRRLAAKILIRTFKSSLVDALLPRQLGCGVPGGAEAAVHAVRAFLHHSSNDVKVILKLDYANAFDSVRRDWMLEQVAKYAPSLHRRLLFVW